MGNVLPRKNLAKIMAQHGMPYVATACAAFPFDFIAKLRKAASIEGPKFIDLLTPCIPGWGIADDSGIDVGKKLVDSGIWPLYEIENKKVTISLEPKMIPVEDALMMQTRFKHLSKEQIADIQSAVNKEWDLIRQDKFWESEEY